MKFLEKDLEEIIYTSDRNLLEEKGLTITGKLLRQVRIGNYGIADLIEHDRPYYHTYFKEHMKGTITVYELKQDKIGISAFLQALGYLKGIKSYLKKLGLENNYNYSIVLIGKTIDTNSTFCYLSEFINEFDNEISLSETPRFSINNYLYDFDINGLNFKSEHNYYLTMEGF